MLLNVTYMPLWYSRGIIENCTLGKLQSRLCRGLPAVRQRRFFCAWKGFLLFSFFPPVYERTFLEFRQYRRYYYTADSLGKLSGLASELSQHLGRSPNAKPGEAAAEDSAFYQSSLIVYLPFPLSVILMLR